MEINIPDEKLEGFNQNAKNQFRNAVEDFSDDVISESLRIESEQNSTGAGAEVTSTIVDLANKSFRNGLIKKKISRKGVAFKILSNLLWCISGGMIFSDKMKEQWFIIVFTFVLLGSFLFTAFDFLKNE